MYICLYQIERVLVMVISPLPSSELYIHIKIESPLLNLYIHVIAKKLGRCVNANKLRTQLFASELKQSVSEPM